MEGSDVLRRCTMSEATRRPTTWPGVHVDVAGIGSLPRRSPGSTPPTPVSTPTILGDWLGLDGDGIAARRASGDAGEALACPRCRPSSASRPPR